LKSILRKKSFKMEKILFVSFHTRNIIATRIMSNILKKDYIVDVLFFIDFEVLPPNQQKIKINYLELKKLFEGYKYILITVNNYIKNIVLKILKNMNQKIRNKVILGGPTIITDPNYFSGFVSHLCFWEGENIDDYLKHINDNEEVPNFDKSKLYHQINNLDNLPLQNTEFNHYYFHIKNKIIVKKEFDYNGVYTMETMRGCPFNCTFCTNKIYNQIKKSNNLSIIRKKSINRIFKELTFFKKKGFYIIEIIDNNFFLRSLEEIRKFVSRYNKDINLPLYLDIDFRSENFLEKFKEINKIKNKLTLFIGIQNGDEDFRKKEFNRIMSNKKIIYFDNKMHKIKNRKMKIRYDFIWGHPSETESTIINNIKLIRKLKGRIELYRYSELAKGNNDSPFSNTDLLSLNNRFLYMQMMFFVYLNNKSMKIGSIGPIRNKIICKIFSNYAFSKIYSYLLLIKSRFKRLITLQKAYHRLTKD